MQARPATVSPITARADEGGPGNVMPFEGFEPPESNYWRLPNSWFDVVAHFTSWAEHKVVEYVLRHTWGYQEYGISKLITMDEFMHGRKRRDGSRMDAGCGMAENSIKKGIADAVAHGFLTVEVDDSDRGRIKKYYAPRMRVGPEDEGEHAVETRHTRARVSTASTTQPAQRQPQPPQGQALLGRGQSLTPEDHALLPEDPRLTVADQGLIPAPHPLTLSAPIADPRTEQIPSEDTYKKASAEQQHGGVHTQQPAADASGSSAREPDPAALLLAEGIAPTRVRALVARYPAERILRQIGWIDERRYENRQATLVAAIERDFSAPPQRSAYTEPARFDRGKFYRGAFAICPECGSRPCLCERSLAAEG